MIILLILSFGENTPKTSKELWLKTEDSNIPVSFSGNSSTSKLDRAEVDEFIAAYYQAGRKRTNIFERKYVHDNFVTNEEFQIQNEKHLAQREKLINYVFGIFNKYGFTGAVIGLTGISLIVWFGIATISEFIKYLILRFLGYVVSRLV